MGAGSGSLNLPGRPVETQPAACPNRAAQRRLGASENKALKKQECSRSDWRSGPGWGKRNETSACDFDSGIVVRGYSYRTADTESGDTQPGDRPAAWTATESGAAGHPAGGRSADAAAEHGSACPAADPGAAGHATSRPALNSAAGTTACGTAAQHSAARHNPSTGSTDASHCAGAAGRRSSGSGAASGLSRRARHD